MSYDTETEQPLRYAERDDGTLVLIESDAGAAPVDRPSRVGPFVAGVVSTLVAGAIALAVFVLVSDRDDDGRINLDVPAVDLSVDG